MCCMWSQMDWTKRPAVSPATYLRADITQAENEPDVYREAAKPTAREARTHTLEVTHASVIALAKTKRRITMTSKRFVTNYIYKRPKHASIEVFDLSDHFYIRELGMFGLPKDLRFLCSFIDSAAFGEMSQNEFVLLPRKKSDRIRSISRDRLA